MEPNTSNLKLDLCTVESEWEERSLIPQAREPAIKRISDLKKRLERISMMQLQKF
jgi:hypothetical protein